MLVSGPNQRFVSQLSPRHGWDNSNSPPELLIVGWTAAGLLFVASLGILPYNQIIAIAGFASTFLLAFHLARLTSKTDSTALVCHEVVITSDQVVLQTYDLGSEAQTEVALRFNEIRSAELNSDSLLLIAYGERLSIPLWAFGNNSPLIVELLTRSGVRLVDTRFPS